MRVLTCVTLLLASASSFVPQQQRAVSHRIAMADSEREAGGALVPIKEETVEFTAGILGGVVGLVLGGPLLGAIGAAAANYISKMDGDAPDVVQAVSKSSIEVFNYMANLDKKYQILQSAKNTLQKSLDKLKDSGSVDPATITKVETALANTNAKIKELNDEYDLIGGSTTVLGVVGDLVEKGVKKISELNSEYQLSDKAKQSLAKAVEKAKEAAKTVA